MKLLWIERTEVDAVLVAAAPRLGLRDLAYHSATTGYLIHNTYVQAHRASGCDRSRV